jgi:hypothetical protein
MGIQLLSSKRELACENPCRRDDEGKMGMQ